MISDTVTAPERTTDWVLLDAEPVPDGVVGGDDATDSISIRFQHVTEPAQVTVYLYAIDLTECGYGERELDGQPFDVEEMVMFQTMESREPGAEEVWADYTYDRPSQVFFETVLDAEDYRDREMSRWIKMGASHFLSWDGTA